MIHIGGPVRQSSEENEDTFDTCLLYLPHLRTYQRTSYKWHAYTNSDYPFCSLPRSCAKIYTTIFSTYKSTAQQDIRHRPRSINVRWVLPRFTYRLQYYHISNSMGFPSRFHPSAFNISQVSRTVHIHGLHSSRLPSRCS